MDYYAEWCSRPNRRSGTMVKEQELVALEGSADAGYRSVYTFDEDAAKEIRASGNSKNFARFDAHSSVLFIDLDNGDRNVPRLREWAISSKADVQLYTSGSKGYHAHVSIVPMTGKGVPLSQANFVSELGIESDSSLYRPNSLIALPGRLHAKTHKKKTLVEHIKGNPIEIPLVSLEPKLDFSNYSSNEGSVEQVMREMHYLVAHPPKNGNRYLSLQWLAKIGMQAGISANSMWVFINEVNKSWSNPKEQSELERAIKDTYHV